MPFSSVKATRLAPIEAIAPRATSCRKAESFCATDRFTWSNPARSWALRLELGEGHLRAEVHGVAAGVDLVFRLPFEQRPYPDADGDGDARGQQDDDGKYLSK
jgi:hypothetical protein